MAKIINNGYYPPENIAECDGCHCKFKYYNSEITIDTSTPDEEDLFDGFGISKYVKCPQCGNEVMVSCNFYPNPSLGEVIKDKLAHSKLIKKIRIKFKKKKGSK